jgi:hypothetical protein
MNMTQWINDYPRKHDKYMLFTLTYDYVIDLSTSILTAGTQHHYGWRG